jgi:PPM family protein phosphatase
MVFLTAMISEAGGRVVNEDFTSFHSERQGGIWTLADGLGGYQGGEVAAELTVRTVIESFDVKHPLSSIKKGIDRAQEVLHLEQQASVKRRSMRTTIVVLACQENRAYWLHVGDSRLYFFQQGHILSRTKDHSVCQALVNAGEMEESEIRFHEDRNRLYRVLGSEGSLKATIQEEGLKIRSGDAFLLCSDGFWEYITESEMESTKVRASNPKEWLEAMEEILKERVSDGHDNYSAIAVFIQE